MQCPKCGCDKTPVFKVAPRFELTIRRRECSECAARFNTMERFTGGLAFPPHHGRTRAKDR